MSALRLRREGVACSDLGSEIVLLDLDSSTYFSVQGTAKFLVSTLLESSGSTADVLIERLLETYETTEETARSDVDAFLSTLENRNLIERLDE